MSSAQGRSSRRHYVPEGQFVALCGFLPGLGGKWRTPLKTARTCTDCHRLRNSQQGIDYSQGRPNAKALSY